MPSYKGRTGNHSPPSVSLHKVLSFLPLFSSGFFHSFSQ
ncbi:hypothetical protein EVA_14566 [gut metagenome]|uniref:Uncharacterized protein n=1 Tax=gut metagenome TaxID=749906 RepID=J9GD68_9ZZZZ